MHSVDYVYTGPGGQQIEIEVYAKNFGDDLIDKLVEARKEKGLTQQDIADATGLQRANVSRFERKTYAPSIEIMTKYAAALGKRIDFELKDNEEN